MLVRANALAPLAGPETRVRSAVAKTTALERDHVALRHKSARVIPITTRTTVRSSAHPNYVP